jgi:hypothetical protein
MKKAINYAVLGGSALTTFGGAVAAFNAFKDKKWLGVAFGALTIGISVAAFKHSLDAVKTTAVIKPAKPTESPKPAEDK